MTSISDTNVVNAPGGLVELGYSQITSVISVPVTAATSPTTIISDMPVVCDGGPIIIEFFAPIVRPGTAAGNIIYINLYQDGAELDRGFAYIETPAAGFSWNPVHLARRITPTAGLHTFSIRAYSVGNAGSINAGSGGTGFSPAFLRVSKIIQASQLIVQTPNAPLVTSLPSNAIDGQEVRYLADNTNGIVWNFRYRAGSSSAYKWEFIGGPSYRVGTTSSEATSSTTYTTLASGPQISVPLAGDYSVYTECQMASASTGSGAMAYDVGATTANDIDAIWSQVSGPGYSNTGSVIRTKTISNAGTILTMKYKSPQSVSVSFLYRYFEITPIRVSA